MNEAFVVKPAPLSCLSTTDGAFFPLRRIYCVARNYADHALEMGHDPGREPPFFFQKNPQNLRSDGLFPYPRQSADVHHEVELMVGLGIGGRDIPTDGALDHVWGYGIALDMTCRDLQAEAKKMGRPWVSAKSFEHSAPCSSIRSAAETRHPQKGAITLDVNGERRQTGDLGQQIWSVAEVISLLSREFELAPGDVVLTGTPSGVGPVQVGDLLEAKIEGVGDLRVEVTASSSPL